MNRFLAIAAGVAVTITAAVRGAEKPYELKPDNQLEVNSILASVNGEPISLWDVLPATRQQEYQAYAAYSGDRLYEAIRQIRRKTVDDLIDRKLLIADYREKPFELSKQEIEAELDNIAERMGYRARSEFIREAREAGSSLEKIRRNVEESLIVQLMLFRRVHVAENVTPKEVYEYYKAHSEEFVKPETIELGLLLLSPDRPDLEAAAETVGKKLAADPESFAALAREYSSGPDAGNGGNLGQIERRRLRPEFAAAMPSPEKGKVYGPIRTGDGVSFLKVLNHNPAEQREFRKLTPEIRRRIEQEKREKIREEYIKQLRQNAIIRYFF